jgi:predicted ester cyclase
MAERLEALARAYFDCWNTRDGAAVGRKFAESGTLRDWDIAVAGAQAVGEANGNIFKAVPGISVTVERILADVAKSSAACEILVHLNDADKTVLKVVDVIEFDASGLITALRAYKG